MSVNNKFAMMKPFKMSQEQKKIVKKIQEDNKHKVISTSILGHRSVNLAAAALQLNPEYLINRARQIRSRK